MGVQNECAQTCHTASRLMQARVCAGLQHILTRLKGQAGLLPDLPEVLHLCNDQLLAAAVSSQIQAARLLQVVLGRTHPSFNAAAYAAFTAGLPYSLATVMTQATLSSLKEREGLR